MEVRRGLKRHLEYVRTDKLFNFRPVFFSALAFTLGILFAYLQIVFGVSAWWLLALLPILGTPFFFCRSLQRLKATALGVVLLLVGFTLGNVGIRLQFSRFNDAGRYQGEFSVHGRVEEKLLYDEYVALVLGGVTIEGKAEEGRLVAYLPPWYADVFRLSDEVALEGEVENAYAVEADGTLNAYALYEDNRFVMHAENCAVTGHTFDLFLEIRNRISETLYAGMDKETAGFTLAVLTGDISGIQAELLQNVRYGGVAHVFAVSGLHIGAVFAFCLLLIRYTPLRRAPKWARFAFCAGVLLFYGGVCGYSPSVVRALTTCLLFYGAKLLGISTDATECLGGAHLLVLLLSPAALFTAGFQLSFAAVYGLVWLSRPIAEGLHWVCDEVKGVFVAKAVEDGETHPLGLGGRIRRACVNFLAVSISSQLFTAPICLVRFGYLSVISLFLNCLFIPLISGAFAFLLALALLACIFPLSWSFVFLYLPDVLLSGVLLLFHTVDFSPSCITLTLDAGGLVCWYLALLFCTDKWNISKGAKIVIAVAFFLAFGATVYALNC